MALSHLHATRPLVPTGHARSTTRPIKATLGIPIPNPARRRIRDLITPSASDPQRLQPELFKVIRAGLATNALISFIVIGATDK